MDIFCGRIHALGEEALVNRAMPLPQDDLRIFQTIRGKAAIYPTLTIACKPSRLS